MKIDYSFDEMRTAYIAGLFDGEGSITIMKSTQGYATLRIDVCNTDQAPLLFIKHLFGGSINESLRTGKWKSVFHWQLFGYPAAEVLERLLPYLIVKKKRALLGMQVIGASYREQQRIFDEMRELNKTGGAQ